MSEPKVTISRDVNRWHWDLWWDDGDDMGHGIGGWANTKIGARIAVRRARKASADA